MPAEYHYLRYRLLAVSKLLYRLERIEPAPRFVRIKVRAEKRLSEIQGQLDRFDD